MSEPTINSLDNRIVAIETKLNTMEDTLNRIERGIELIEQKKAGKWVEKAIIGVVIFVLTAVGTALLALVIKQ